MNGPRQEERSPLPSEWKPLATQAMYIRNAPLPTMLNNEFTVSFDRFLQPDISIVHRHQQFILSANSSIITYQAVNSHHSLNTTFAALVLSLCIDAITLAAASLFILLQLRVMTPNTIRVIYPPVTLQIRLDIRPLLDGIVQLKHAVMLASLPQLLHRLGESILCSIKALACSISNCTKEKESSKFTARLT